MPQFTEQNPEPTQRSEFSSAGVPTQRFVGSSHQQPLARNQRNTAVALVLLCVGLLMLVGRISSSIVGWTATPGAYAGSMELAPGMVLFTIASCLLFFAFWRRSYGLLIPGCLLAGLGIGAPFAGVIGPAAVLWGLALGFLAILLLGRRLFRINRLWPIYAGVPLFGVGTIAAIMEAQHSFALVNALLWLPVLLIGAGLYLGWGRKTAT